VLIIAFARIPAVAFLTTLG